MLPRLQPYDLVIRYQPGKSMEISDALSRLSQEEKEAIPVMSVEVHAIYPQFSNDMLQRIWDETAVDPELNALKETIHLGWPSAIQQVSALLKSYWPFRNELAVEDGIAMKSHRIIIPVALQKEILTRLHSAHQGTENTKLSVLEGPKWRHRRDNQEMYHLPGTATKPAKRTTHFYRSTTRGMAHHWHRHLHLGGFRTPSSRWLLLQIPICQADTKRSKQQ